MQENNKRIAKNTLFLYIRMLLTMLVTLYTSRVVLSTLGIKDFGIYNVVGGVVALFGILNGTLASGTQRFLTFQLGRNDLAELKKTFSVSLNIHIIFAVIILILGETVGLWFLRNKINIPIDREIAALWVYHFSVFAVALSVIQVPYNATIIAHERMNVYAYVSILDVSLKLLIVYLLTISDYDKLITYSILMFAVNIIIVSIYCIYCRRKYLECRFGLVPDKKLYKTILTFSGWNILGSAAGTGSTQGVNILLNIFYGPAINAARGISVQVSNAIMAFVNNFQTAVNPQIVKLYATGKINELHTILFQNAKFSFCLMWCLLLPMLLKLETVLELWLVEIPEYTALFCRLILLQTLISCLQRPFVMAIYAIGKTKIVNLTSALISLSALPISYFLLKQGMPVYIPFVIYIITSAICAFIELFLLYKWISLSINILLKQVFIPIISIILCSLPISFLVNYYSAKNFISFLYVLALSITLVLTSVYYIALDKKMRITIKKKLIELIKKSKI